ncbi:MAG: hypothetical protein HYU57_04675 [Micavibrio aeruginosavorus]|nr:hypothetical protein [Micavibrio aeruginosavorus]
MKLQFMKEVFPDEGIKTHSGKLAIVNGARDINSIEIDHGTIEGQRLKSQFHLALVTHDAFEGRDMLHILASSATKESLIDKLRQGVKVSDVDLWFDSLPRKSLLRDNFKVDGVFL